MKAVLKHYKQSPRKVRLVCDLLRGKSVDAAYAELAHTNKRATIAIKKLLDSAVANAKEGNFGEKENLYVKSVKVDKGIIVKRYRSRARGVSKPIRHRRSHIEIELAAKKIHVKGNAKTKTNPIKRVLTKVKRK